ncbi:transcription termination factor 1-like [Engraulis encrasicolus]|uniref:transcription termination factor 1-like n=1 Tax=Engraulis encrasicolus TaxID=184585 RepID=UPI002FD06216
MEAENMVHKKSQKKKKNKKHPAVKLTEYQACEEITIHQKKQKKKKKVKVRPNENDSRPAEVHGDEQGKKIKRKRKHVPSVGGEFEDSCQGRAVTNKRKKRRIEEMHKMENADGNIDTEMTLTPTQINGKAVNQTSVKSKSEKLKKRAQPRVSSATDAQPHPNKAVSKKIAPNIDKGILQEIKEYLPSKKLTDLTVLREAIMYDLPRFREFKEQGIPVRTRRFTVAENNRLKQNVKDFLALSGIESVTKLFLPKRFPDGKEIIKMKRKLGFISCLCAGIPRSWDSILCKARDLLNPGNYLGRFTEKENRDLINLHKLYGRKWGIISEQIGRSHSALKKRFGMICEGHGPWTEEESRSLLRSVRQHLLKLAKPGEDGSIGSGVVRKVDLYKRLPWAAVSQQVRTRSWILCREKWMGYLKMKMTTGVVITSRKSLESEIQLIKAINEMNVEDTAEIVWDELTHLFGNTTPQYLQMRFYRLKVSHVPGWNRMTDFGEIIDYLYEKTLPNLQEKLRNCKEDEEPTEERDSYKLSEIFPDLP